MKCSACRRELKHDSPTGMGPVCARKRGLAPSTRPATEINPDQASLFQPIESGEDVNRHQHPTNNDVLGAPPGTPIEECNALPITRVIWEDTGGHGVVSYWMPSTEERELIAAGQPVRLTMLGQTHPPLAIGVDGDGVL